MSSALVRARNSLSEAPALMATSGSPPPPDMSTLVSVPATNFTFTGSTPSATARGVVSVTAAPPSPPAPASGVPPAISPSFGGIPQLGQFPLRILGFGHAHKDVLQSILTVSL